MNTVSPPARAIADEAASYIVTINSLSAKYPSSQQKASSTVSPIQDASPRVAGFSSTQWYTLGATVIFVVLLGSAFSILLSNRIRDIKSTVMAIAIVFMLAAVPVLGMGTIQRTNTVTKAGPDDIPRSVRVQTTATDACILTWSTDAEKTGVARFGPLPLDDRNARMRIADQGQPTKLHTVVLDGLQPGKSYELEIQSGSVWFNDNGKPIRFTTAAR